LCINTTNKFILLVNPGLPEFTPKEGSTMMDRTAKAWLALRRCLEQYSLELHQAVCSYPTPIARCDLQLSAAIEQRDTAFRLWRSALDLHRQRTLQARAAWLAQLRDFALGLRSAPDARLSAASRRLLAALPC
jgi:hypothetical protein